MKQLALALLLLLLAMAATAVRAQEAIRVLDARAENRFPEGVLFTLTAQGAAPIQRVTLNYNLGGRANTFAAPTFTPGTTVRAELQLKVDGRLYIAPGTVITYYWQLEDEAGRRLNTEATTITYDDTRFSWQRLSQGKLTLSWYGGSRAGAERLLQAGADAIDRIAALTGADMAGTAAKVWAYASSQDMQPVLVRRSEAFERNVVTAGERVSDDTVVILTSGGAEDTLRHELAHVVTHVAGEGAFGGLPPWLDEGTAVYAQSSPGGYAADLNDAIRRDRLLPISSLTSTAGTPGVVNLWYGQSWSLVKHLVDTYGREKFAQLFATFKKGSTADDALKRVYGFDLGGLEDGWRRSLGLQPRPPAPTQEPPAAIPTFAPVQGPQPQEPAVPAQPSSEDGASLGLILALVAGFAALAGVVVVWGLFLARRFR